MVPYDELGLPVVATWQWVACIAVWLFAFFGLSIGLKQVYLSVQREARRRVSQLEKPSLHTLDNK